MRACSEAPTLFLLYSKLILNKKPTVLQSKQPEQHAHIRFGQTRELVPLSSGARNNYIFLDQAVIFLTVFFKKYTAAKLSVSVSVCHKNTSVI